MEEKDLILQEQVNDNDFVYVDNKNRAKETKFETKPTTFLKDSIKRFRKNKSSVVAAGILGALLLLAIIVPVADRNDIKKPHPEYTYLQPKLFKSGTGWWDGCKKFANIPYDRASESPNPTDFKKQAILDGSLVLDEVSQINTVNQYGWGGFAKIGFDEKTANDSILFATTKSSEVISLDSEYKVNIGMSTEVPEGYKDGTKFRLYFSGEDDAHNPYTFALTDWMTSQEEVSADIQNVLLTQQSSITKYYNYSFGFEIQNPKDGDRCILVSSVKFSTNSENEDYKKLIEMFNFDDANAMLQIKPATDSGEKIPYYWSCTGLKNAYKINIQTCSFTYDTYEAAFGVYTMEIGGSLMDQYIANGYCSYDYNVGPSSFKRLDDKCPVMSVDSQKTQSLPGGYGTITNLTCEVSQYRYLGFEKAPIFLFGTDKSGRDMFKYVFAGLRTSLLLGLVTFIICFAIGLVWGAISGYYGGAVDLAMERVTDILSGVPWIIVMTLCIIHLGSTFFVFILAECLTGWIGTAALTRTQFYRFKGREYVLASRTLGSRDMRLIFKHILPNAMGTIITSSVLMIPGVIFAEATISYLGLGFKNLSSLGVILSSNQPELLNHPFLLIFPSVIIALVMISFNLFGNGLRDAINPSLKGEE